MPGPVVSQDVRRVGQLPVPTGSQAGDSMWSATESGGETLARRVVGGRTQDSYRKNPSMINPTINATAMTTYSTAIRLP